jgi:hypothetical protein
MGDTAQRHRPTGKLRILLAEHERVGASGRNGERSATNAIDKGDKKKLYASKRRALTDLKRRIYNPGRSLSSK